MRKFVSMVISALVGVTIAHVTYETSVALYEVIWIISAVAFLLLMAFRLFIAPRRRTKSERK